MLGREAELIKISQDLIDVLKHVVMDTEEDRALHTRVVQTWQGALEMEKRLIEQRDEKEGR